MLTDDQHYLWLTELFYKTLSYKTLFYKVPLYKTNKLGMQLAEWHQGSFED